jgi:metal-responsive CopG/Arc/MetJ family transcriptional regulator
MVARAKIAVSLDPRVLARVEKVRKRTGESRSALVNRALAALAQQDAHDIRVAEYLRAYRHKPETVAEVDAIQAAALATLVHLPMPL